MLTKFFVCDKRHTEPYRGEFDGPGMPWRRCGVCKSKMTLMTFSIKLDKADKRYVIEPYVRQRKPTPGAAATVKPSKREIDLKAFVRAMPKYCHYYIDGGIVKRRGGLTRDAETGRIMSRWAEVVIDSDEVRVTLVNAFSWSEDFRSASHRCHLALKLKFCTGTKGDLTCTSG